MGRICGSFGVAAAAMLLALLALASTAAADSMVVQPDGKILVIGHIWPEAGALGRLEPDGTIDPSFGQEGFLIDRRLPPFQALAQEGDGRIVPAAAGGVRLGRYLPDGTPDPSFAAGGVAGTQDPDQFLGPTAIQVSPGGAISVAENHLSPSGARETWIKRYDANGTFVDNVGHVAQVGAASSPQVTDLAEGPDGSVVGAGSIVGPPGESALLARFLPGSGPEHDSSFGAGAGVVLLSLPSERQTATWFDALAGDGEKLLAAGSAEKSFLVARFSADGTLDQGFGDGGHAVLPIAGPSAGAEWARSWAMDVATLGNGEVLLGGGTSEWGTPLTGKLQIGCGECPQPLLAEVDAAGKLDPSFGTGGILRLLKPDGGILDAAIERVAPLSDGKILVKGAVPIPETAGLQAPFVARLNADGSYDPTFGEGGLTVVGFPCTDQSRTERRRMGCVASLRAKVGLGGLHQRRPVLSVRAWPSLDWAAVRDLTLTLPKYLRLTGGFRSKLSVRGPGDKPQVHVVLPHDQKPYTILVFSELGSARQLRVRFQPGALHLRGRIPRRGLTFKLRVHFSDLNRDDLAGHDEVTRRAG